VQIGFLCRCVCSPQLPELSGVGPANAMSYCGESDRCCIETDVAGSNDTDIHDSPANPLAQDVRSALHPQLKSRLPSEPALGP
jgi:hypothetical protein